MDSEFTVFGSRKSPRFVAADLLLALALALLASNAILSIWFYFFGTGEPAQPTPATLWVTVSTNFLIFALLPMAWVLTTVYGGWPGAKRYLGMRGGWGDAAMGVGLGVLLVMVLGGASLLLDKFGLVPESAPIEDLLTNLTWPLAIAFSLVAAVGEEILFRGILQRWLQWWGQGLLFGALHIANAGLYAFIAVGFIGLLFGYLRHRGTSLWTLIAAHFTYNMILMSTALLYPDAATGGTAWLP